MIRFIFLLSFISLVPSAFAIPPKTSPREPAPMIALKDLSQTINEQTALILKKRGLNTKTLSAEEAVLLEEKLDQVTQDLTEKVATKAEASISLTEIQKSITTNFDTFIKDIALKAQLPKIQAAVDTFSNQLLQENKISLDKLPSKKQQEFTRLKDECVVDLFQLMSNINHDYVTQQELARICHKKLDLFIERARYILLTIGSQNILQQINATKTLTHTTPFVKAESKKA